MEEIVYQNGSLIPRVEAKVSVFDQGFLYGYGLFETMRAYGGSIFRLERHINRLLDSAQAIGLSQMPVSSDLVRACNDTLSANHLADARLRLTVSRGEVDGFPGTKIKATPTILITARAYKPLSPEVYSRGYRAIISSLRQNSQSPLSRVKSTNYLLSLLAKVEAEKAGLDEALLLNERGFLTEGSTSNVFFVEEKTVVTPSLASGLLPGITREAVIELVKGLGLGVKEDDIKPEGLDRFNEAFLTNSVMEIMPLVGVRHGEKTITFGPGRMGDITRRLASGYQKLVERETRNRA